MSNHTYTGKKKGCILVDEYLWNLAKSYRINRSAELERALAERINQVEVEKGKNPTNLQPYIQSQYAYNTSAESNNNPDENVEQNTTKVVRSKSKSFNNMMKILSEICKKEVYSIKISLKVITNIIEGNVGGDPRTVEKYLAMLVENYALAIYDGNYQRHYNKTYSITLPDRRYYPDVFCMVDPDILNDLGFDVETDIDNTISEQSKTDPREAAKTYNHVSAFATTQDGGDDILGTGYDHKNNGNGNGNGNGDKHKEPEPEPEPQPQISSNSEGGINSSSVPKDEPAHDLETQLSRVTAAQPEIPQTQNKANPDTDVQKEPEERKKSREYLGLGRQEFNRLQKAVYDFVSLCKQYEVEQMPCGIMIKQINKQSLKPANDYAILLMQNNIITANASIDEFKTDPPYYDIYYNEQQAKAYNLL